MNWLIQRLAEAISAILIPAIEKAIAAEFDRLTTNAEAALGSIIPGKADDAAIDAALGWTLGVFHKILGR